LRHKTRSFSMQGLLNSAMQNVLLSEADLERRVGITYWQVIQQRVSVKICLLAKRNNVYLFREHEIIIIIIIIISIQP